MSSLPNCNSLFINTLLPPVNGVAQVIFTVRKRNCGKVMFLHLSVSHSVHGGCACRSACWDTQPPRAEDAPGQASPPEQAPPLDRHSLPLRPHPSSCCGRYSSYWNPILFLVVSFCLFVHRDLEPSL